MPRAGVRHPDGVSARIPLPPSLALRPFSVSTAAAAGVREGRLRGSDLERPFYGVRRVRSDAPTGETVGARERRLLLERCLAYLPRLAHGHHFSHVTAARLWGCPLPTRFDENEPLDVSRPGRATRCEGIVGHSSAAPIVATRLGFPVSDPASTWLALASTLSRDDLVAIGDHLILEPRQLEPSDPRPHVTLEALGERAAAFHGRGARAAASALALLRQGAESRPETLLRLLLVRAGFGEPELQAEIRDAAGRWLGYADLYWPERRVVVEYDGEHHRTDSRAYDRDMTRIEDFVAARNAVVRVRKGALFGNPASVVARVQRAFDRNPGVP